MNDSLVSNKNIRIDEIFFIVSLSSFFSSEDINPSEFFVFDKYTFCKLPDTQFNLFQDFNFDKGRK